MLCVDMPRMTPSAFGALRDAAAQLGLPDLRATPAQDLAEARARLHPGAPASTGLADWLEAGRHGEMEWMAGTAELRMDPRAWWPPARTALVAAVDYDGIGEPGDADDTSEPGASRGRVSRYAWGRDYHDVIKTRLMALGRVLEREAPGASWRTCVDRGAAMEKPLAVLAGHGWIGRHGNLIGTRGASWQLLGVLLTDVEIEPDAPFAADHCGTCTACIDACPTGAIVGPAMVDARRCISYLTIEKDGASDRSLRSQQGSWVFGCDACQDACPWNRHRSRAGDPRLSSPRVASNGRQSIGRGPGLSALMQLDEAAFTRATPASAIKRTRRDGLVRNAATAAGNSGDDGLVPDLARLLREDPAPSVREHAAWALGRLGGVTARRALEAAAGDPDPGVRAEVSASLEGGAPA